MISINLKQIARHRRLVQCVLCATKYPSWPVSYYSTQPLAEPSPSGGPKTYPVKIHNIVNEISKLTLLEVAELNELLKKSLNIPDAAPVMPMGFMPMAAPTAKEGEEAEVQTAKTSFTVKLLKFDETKKVALIREIKGLMEGMNLVQMTVNVEMSAQVEDFIPKYYVKAKKFVESVPQVVKADIGKDEAEKLKNALEAVGASVDVD